MASPVALHDHAALHAALAARDRRFDGVFYVGVTSTGIYCRPVCTARTPRPANCRFFESAAAAEAARFRPCLRCRPELAPGLAPVDDRRRIAALLVQRLDEGRLDGEAGLERVAERFGWSARQLRRMVRQELGVSPIALVLTRRLLLAKQLLTETALPVTEVAFASGFASLRRFNDAFVRQYGLAPSRFRREAAGGGAAEAGAPLTLRLAYRPPYDWAGTLAFLAGRATAGVERVADDAYARTVRLGAHAGWLRVAHDPARHGVAVELAPSLLPVLPALLGRLRHLLDLDAQPDAIDGHLAGDPVLAPLVARVPGLRVPGAMDGFELLVRAVLGQQVTVRAATTLAGRLATALGDAIDTPDPALARLFPTPERVAAGGPDAIAELGVTAARARTIAALAAEVAAGRLQLDPGADAEATIARLVAIPGIGPWTAHYVALRALRWPDAFPADDVVLRRRLGSVGAAAAERMAERWRPWRGYAALHLWRAAALDAAVRR